VATISLDHCYSAVEGVTGQSIRRSVSSDFEGSENGAPSAGGAAKGGSIRGFSPKRRSQRQIDRMELEQLRKIRAENEEMLKKEKEEMVKLTPSKKENMENPEADDTSSEVVQPTSGKKVEGSSGYRITTLRQEIQAKALAFEPTTPTKAKSNVTTPVHLTTPAVVKSSQDSTSIASPVPDADSTNSKLGSASRTDSGVTNSGGVARPRRENRQPPKHLREAFVQLEEDGMISVLKTTPKATNEILPEEQVLTPVTKGKSTKKFSQIKSPQPMEAETVETDAHGERIIF
jgi:hypothetical protein